MLMVRSSIGHSFGSTKGSKLEAGPDPGMIGDERQCELKEENQCRGGTGGKIRVNLARSKCLRMGHQEEDIKAR